MKICRLIDLQPGQINDPHDDFYEYPVNTATLPILGQYRQSGCVHLVCIEVELNMDYFDLFLQNFDGNGFYETSNE